MVPKQEAQRRTIATRALEDNCPEIDGGKIVDSLSGGLTNLRDTLVTRAHEDVERASPLDSMIAPVSEAAERKEIERTKLETDIYSIIVAADEVKQGGYLSMSDESFLDWLFRLRMNQDHEAEFRRRVEFYRSPTVEERRLKFLEALQEAIPESVRTPLILFRMFPRAIRIVAAVAFGDLARAEELRAEQGRFLPALRDCQQCHGRVLENDENCHVCGNPVWGFDWLQSD